MLLYYGSNGMMHDGNARLCDVHHSTPKSPDPLRLSDSSPIGLGGSNDTVCGLSRCPSNVWIRF
jgi:hypothetical protein